MPIKVGYRGHQLMMTASVCACGARHNAITQDVFVERGLLAALPELIAQRELGRICTLVSDAAHPDPARAAEAILTERGYKVTTCALDIGHAPPDERALGAVLMRMGMETEFLLAVGGESVTEAARAVATQTERPLAAVPASPSSSAFVGLRSRLARGGEVVHLPAVCPELVVCDMDLLADAAPELLLAGLLDLVGKYAARVDFVCAKGAKGEPYCEDLAQVASGAANKALKRAPEIADREPTGIKALTESLLLCGMASVVYGGARPICGAEQLVADAWTEQLLADRVPMPPHGQLVGASALALMERYRALAGDGKWQRKLAPEALEAIEAMPDPARVRAALAALGAVPSPPASAIAAASDRAAKTARHKQSPIRLMAKNSCNIF